LMMSTLPPTDTNINRPTPQSTPRWLATLNPQAPVPLRKPFVENGGGRRSNFNPSYLTENYIFNENIGTYVHRDLPQADSSARVSAGTRVSNDSVSALPMIVRAFQPEHAPLFSLAQLQHAN